MRNNIPFHFNMTFIFKYAIDHSIQDAHITEEDWQLVTLFKSILDSAFMQIL